MPNGMGAALMPNGMGAALMPNGICGRVSA